MLALGIDLPRDLGTRRLPWRRLWRIIEHLSPDSATSRSRRNFVPSMELQLLRRIDYWTHLGSWLQTEDARKKRNQPVMVPFPGDKDRAGGRGPLELDTELARRQARRAAELAGMNQEDN